MKTKYSIMAVGFTATVLILLGSLYFSGCGGATGAATRDPKDMTLGGPEAKLSMQAPSSKQLLSGPELSIAPEVKPLVNAKEHNVRIDCTHEIFEVTDGVKYAAWTFGGHLPGPVLRIREGDKVNFTMTNRSDKNMGVSPPSPHSIDFHSAMVNPHDKYREVIPGATIEFSWVANYPGLYMYHCGSPAILQHMIYGMIGAVIVEPKAGYPTKVDQEYVLIQSEHYLTKLEDGTYATDMATARKKDPKYVTFNGKPAQYVQKPLQAKTGDRVRLYVLNAGPSGTSSFHVVGTIFDKVWLDGNPENELRGMQTVLLGSSNGAIVEFVLPEPGDYPFVDHEFADVELGAVGIIQATGEALAAK